MSKFKPVYFKPLWTAKTVLIPIEEFKVKEKIAIITALNFIGQEFIKTARNGGSYKDRTGNLRSSIGYSIYDEGKLKKQVYEKAENDENGDGVQAGKQLSDKLSNQKGIVLIVTAGMDYAYYVESKGFNVLTVFAPSDSQVKRDLQTLLKYV